MGAAGGNRQSAPSPFSSAVVLIVMATVQPAFGPAPPEPCPEPQLSTRCTGGPSSHSPPCEKRHSQLSVPLGSLLLKSDRLGLNVGSETYELALQPWASYFTSLCLRFLIYKTGKIITTSPGSCDDETG